MKYIFILLAALALSGGYYYFSATPAPAPSPSGAPSPSSNGTTGTPPPSEVKYSSHSPAWKDSPPWGLISITAGGFLFTKDRVWPVGIRVKFENTDKVSHTIASDKCPELNIGVLAPKEQKWAEVITTAKVCDFYDKGNVKSSDHRGTVTTK